MSSGQRKVHRLSRRGNRKLNHAIHMAAITQIGNRRSEGHAYYGKKLAEGKTPKEALRSLKRQVSNAMFARLQAEPGGPRRSRSGPGPGPGGQQGNGSVASVAGSHPRRRLFGQATPGPGHHPTPHGREPGSRPLDATRERPTEPLDTKRHSICTAAPFVISPGGCVQIRPIWRLPGRRN